MGGQVNDKFDGIISFSLTWIVIANLFFNWTATRAPEPEITSEQVIELIDSPDVKKRSLEEAERLQSEDKDLFKAYTSNHYYYCPQNAELDIYPPTSQPGGLTFVLGRGRVVSHRLNNERREFAVECEEPARARIETYRYPH